MKNKTKKILLFLAFIAVVFIINENYDLTNKIQSLLESNSIKDLVQKNRILAMSIYVAISSIGSSLLAVPGITFTVIGSMLFEVHETIILCLVWATLGATISFLLSRFLIKESIKPLVMKNNHIKSLLFDNKENPLTALMITRLVPLFPYNLQNYAYGITDIKITKYIIYTFIFMSPATVMYVLLFSSMIDNTNMKLYLVISIIIFIAMYFITKKIKQKYIKDVEDKVQIMDIQDNNKCISCKKCTNNCDFLKKYDLDFSDRKKLKDLAYNCFLCGKCSEVCPIKIDGKNEILNLRKEIVKENNNKLKESSLIQIEKQDYIFKNYKKANKKSVLFTGCNFVGVYLNESLEIINILERYEIGVVYDCCGKPISELGLFNKEQEITNKLNEKFKQNNIEQIITICPNCYYYLKDRVNVEVINIYEKLKELNIGRKLKKDIEVFMPCPDKKDKKWLEDISYFVDGEINLLTSANCCGLGGCASNKEAEISKSMCDAIKKEAKDGIHVYCGSCALNLKSKNANAKMILNEILEIEETNKNQNTLLNRAKFKYKI